MTDSDKRLSLLPEPLRLNIDSKDFSKEDLGHLVKEATSTFGKLLKPLTAFCAGFGTWIELKFASLNDLQKLRAAALLEQTQKKIEAGIESSLSAGSSPDPETVDAIFTVATKNPSPVKLGLCSTAMANELSGVFVHPEFVHLLDRLSIQDLTVLAQVEEDEGRPASFIEILNAIAKTTGLRIVPISLEAPQSLSHAFLQQRNLILQDNARWRLTLIGEAFIKAFRTNPKLRVSKETAGE